MTPDEVIAKSLARIADALDKYLPLVAAGLASAKPSAPGEEVAPDSDLDGQYGDPIIKRDPARWSGASFANMHMSDAPPDYLDALAEFFAWKAGKNDEDAAKAADETTKQKQKKYAKYARIDAARARGWAQRKRNGWVPRGPAEEDMGGAGGADIEEIPF